MGKEKREKMALLRKPGIKLREWSDDKRTEAAYRVREKYARRWMEETEKVTGKHCESIADVDLSIPQIHIEWLLCDPVYATKLKNEEVAREFLGQLTPEELDMFWFRDESGNSYSDLMTPHLRHALASHYKRKSIAEPEKESSRE